MIGRYRQTCDCDRYVIGKHVQLGGNWEATGSRPENSSQRRRVRRFDVRRMIEYNLGGRRVGDGGISWF